MVESVYASVTVQPDSLYEVYSAVGGILDKNLVEENDTVLVGTPILQVINNTPKLNTENARLALELAQKNYKGSATLLTQLETEIKTALLQYQNDSINYFRQKNLWEQNIGTKETFDAKKLRYELSANTLRLLKSRYKTTKNELQSALEQAKNNYKTALITTDDYTVASKINGTVYALYKNPGESITTQQPLASIGRTDTFVIEMLVDEVDIVKVAIGQPVLVTLEAYNATVFEAIVHKIYPKKDERSQTFTVEAVFKGQPDVLYPGLSGEGNIIIAKKENVLTIPKVYLIGTNQVKTARGVITIVTGLHNMDVVEVISGINKETHIYKPED
ncbi:efflux RND transporter periplasmic adaptor subunit [Leptobacterium sp. I13]|uniref:efflux RND transporter periplasmic adaptor subunit n=1 Tax=Leptobacterium meishanense TaxID=3128904 RepID=UPI0030EF7077